MSRMKIMSMSAGRSLFDRAARSVVFEILEPLVLVRRALKRPAFLAWLPLNDFFDLLRQREILVGDSLGGVGDEFDDHERVRHSEVGMVPRGLGKMADRIHDHQRSFPPAGLEFAANPAFLVIPVR